MLLTAIFVVSVIGMYQIENAEAQLTNISSVSELIEQGNSLLDLGKYEETITWYNKALELDPNDAIALTNKGLALFQIGEKDEAFIWIDKALTIDPTNRQILDVKSELQECC